MQKKTGTNRCRRRPYGRALLLAPLLIASAACENRPQSVRRAILMNEIERGVRLPRGAGPLHLYRRHYAWIEPDRRIAAIYVYGGPTGRQWGNRNHMPFDLRPGCNVVSLIYAVGPGRVERIACNRG